MSKRIEEILEFIRMKYRGMSPEETSAVLSVLFNQQTVRGDLFAEFSEFQREKSEKT